MPWVCASDQRSNPGLSKLQASTVLEMERKLVWAFCFLFLFLTHTCFLPISKIVLAPVLPFGHPKSKTGRSCGGPGSVRPTKGRTQDLRNSRSFGSPGSVRPAKGRTQGFRNPRAASLKRRPWASIASPGQEQVGCVCVSNGC
jgi:hypothetical protein